MLPDKQEGFNKKYLKWENLLGILYPSTAILFPIQKGRLESSLIEPLNIIWINFK